VGSLSSSQESGFIPVQIPGSLAPDSGYRIRIRSSNPPHTGVAGTSVFRILARPAAPTANDRHRCGPGSLQLQAAGLPDDSIFWYGSANAGFPLSQGPVFETPQLNSTTSFWVESQRIRNDRLNLMPAFNPGDTLTVANTYHGIYIRVKKTLSLDSLLVFASGPGEVHINLKDSSNTFLYKKVVRQVLGHAQGERLSVGWDISPGIYRLDATSSTVPGLLRLNNFYSYPQVSEGMDVISSSVPGRYYFFYDLQMRLKDCPSERREVKARILDIPAAPQLIQSGNYLVASADTILRWFRDGILLGTFGDSIDAEAFGSGQYQVVLMTTDSCVAYSNTVVVIITGKDQPDNGFVWSVQPNPVHEKLLIQSKHPEPFDLRIVDAAGRVVCSANSILPGSFIINPIPAGVYSLQLKNQKGNQFFLRLIKE
jgi:hypothetical protein